MSNDSSSKHFTRGGQIAFHNIRMLFQINKAIWKLYVFLLFFITFILAYIATPFDVIETAIKYSYAGLLDLIGDVNHLLIIPFEGVNHKATVAKILTHPYFANTLTVVTHNIIISFLVAFVSSIFISIFGVKYLTKKGRKQSESQFVRGSVLETTDKVIKKINSKGTASNIVLDAFPIIKDSEMQHFLVHGTVGTGKSQLMMKFLEGIRKRGDRVIVYDKGCSFTPKFLKEDKDIILNSFDERCANWDLWEEAPRDSDFENMAESLIPLHGENDPFWVMGSRTVFACCASKMRNDPDRSLDKLISLLITNKFEELEDYLQGTAAATLVSGKIEKTAISIRSVLTTYLKSLQTLRGLSDSGKEKFSIKNYIQNEDNDGWLFISSNGEQHSSLKPLISMWLAMASLTLLSLPESGNRRIWFICDELPSLHKLPMLAETIAEVRKFGGCFMLGMQSYAQLGKVYGRDGASEIFDLLNTRFFFRSPSHEMARLVSKELGDEEVEDARENYSYGANSIRDGISVGRNRVTRPIVSYPEVMELPELNCFVRLPGQYPITKLEIKYQDRKQKSSSFIERELPELAFQSTNDSDVREDNHGQSQGKETPKGDEASLRVKDYEEFLESEKDFV